MHTRNLLVGFIVGLTMLAGGCDGTGGKPTETQNLSLSDSLREPVSTEVQSEKDRLEEQWGIKVESAMLSAGGYMVDFRFRVLDAAKAARIFDRRTMPYMIDQATGAKFIVPNPPKVGPLRSGGNIKEGRTYFIFFANPAKYVKSGNKITIVVGDFKIQDVVVDRVIQVGKQES